MKDDFAIHRKMWEIDKKTMLDTIVWNIMSLAYGEDYPEDKELQKRYKYLYKLACKKLDLRRKDL